MNGVPAVPPASASAPAAPAGLARLVACGPGDDVAGWLSRDDFPALGLDPRLTGKLTAPKQAVGTALGGAAAAADEAAASTAVTRGHTRDGFGLSRPTRVQRLFIPPALAGRSLCAKSETGSGKTIAFLAPILHGLLTQHAATPGGMSRSSGLYALILAPTRELCQQIFAVASRLTQPFPFIVPGLVAGGEKRKAEKARLRKGVTLLVATPGRLLDHLRTTVSMGAETLAGIRTLVLDEADRLLDMGFGPQITQVVAAMRAARASSKGKASQLPPWRTYLLSATLSQRVRTLAASVLAEGDTATLLDASASAAMAMGAGHTAAGGLLADNEEDEEEEEAAKAAVAAGKAGEEGEAGKEKEKDKGGRGESRAPKDLVTPSRLTQQYVLAALKWRLPTLLAVLVDAVALARKGRKAAAPSAGAAPVGGARLILFMATCDAVDLHFALLSSLLPGMLAPPGSAGKGRPAPEGGDASPSAPRVLRLHGDLPQAQRTAAVRAFSAGGPGVRVLVTTDVAARGLDLPSVDVIVQADPPSDTQDYVHRVGRTARAGAAGRAVLLLQPHEAPYVELLAAAGLRLHAADVAPMFNALARCDVPAHLLSAPGDAGSAAGADADGGAKQPGEAGGDGKPAAPGQRQQQQQGGGKRPRPDAGGEAEADGEGGGDRPLSQGHSGSVRSFARKVASLMEAAERARSKQGSGGGGAVGSGGTSRWAELQAVLWQTLIEGIVTSHACPAGVGLTLPSGSPEPLLDLARRAFSSFVRAYATHEKATRHIFHPRALHLGHAAKACGLTEQPTQVVARSSKAAQRTARAEAAAEAANGDRGGKGRGAGRDAEPPRKKPKQAQDKREGQQQQGQGQQQGQSGPAAAGASGGADAVEAAVAAAEAGFAPAAKATPAAAGTGASGKVHNPNKKNRLTWRADGEGGPSGAGAGGRKRDRHASAPSHGDDDDDARPASDPANIRQQLLAKARKVQGKAATFSEFAA